MYVRKVIWIYQGVRSCDIFFYVCFVSSCWGYVIIQWFCLLL